MSVRPKPLFWVVVLLVVLSLVAFSLKRMGLFESKSEPGQAASSGSWLPGGSVEVNFYSSSAKKEWINQMVEEFNNGGHRAGGKTITVKAFHVESGQSLDDLKSGKIQPDIWSPGDDSWLQLGGLSLARCKAEGAVR